MVKYLANHLEGFECIDGITWENYPKDLQSRYNKLFSFVVNEIYAKEELRAELTSMFLQQRYNVNFDEKHYENHAAYLQSWAQVIKNDPNEIYRAAADAEKAMSYIETRMINKNLTKDKEKSVQKEMTLENKAPKRIIKQKITMKIDTQKSKSKERTLTR